MNEIPELTDDIVPPAKPNQSNPGSYRMSVTPAKMGASVPVKRDFRNICDLPHAK